MNSDFNSGVISIREWVSNHNDCVTWMLENVGEIGFDWDFDHDLRIVFLRSEDAVAFRLKFGKLGGK